MQYPIRTRYSETGQDGIIHHSAYVVYFEVARIEFFKELGFDVNELEKKGMLCPVVDLFVKYLKPVYSLEDIIVEVTVGEVSKVKFSLKYRILRGETVVATAVISHCIIDEAFKPIALPGEFRKGLLAKTASSAPKHD